MCSDKEQFDEVMSGRVFSVAETEYVVRSLGNYMSERWQRSCTIGISNCSTETLVKPQVHLTSGKIERFPDRIDPGFVGLIAARKSSVAARGTVGVITYELLDIPDRRLQLMWSVPFDFNLYSSWTSARVGWEDASEDLYQIMYYGDDPAPVKAIETPRACPSNSFNMRVSMSNDYNATLILSFKGLYDDDDEEPTDEASEKLEAY